MSTVWAAALYAVFLWWFGTGVALLLGRATRGRALLGATALLGVAIWTIDATAGLRDVTAALAGFTAAVAIWGWHEVTFLTGLLTGPRRTACPLGVRGWRRFRFATETLIHHELALAATALVLWLWLREAANPVALWTFLALWGMRFSVKFNIFFGAPNVADEFLPDDLRYLTTYFSPRPMNLLFPVSVTAGTVTAGGLLLHAELVAATPFEAAALASVGALVALGTLEHWFLVLPVKEAALWRWYIDSRARRRAKRAGKALALAPHGAPTILGR
jgi:putative photosynthetic complex assembly protein 2